MSIVMSSILPYVACIIFVGGVILRIAGWLKVPVPFHLALFPVPGSRSGKFMMLASEFLFCRTLFREDRFLWLLVWLFHVSLVLVLAGHVIGIYYLRNQFTLIGFMPETSRTVSVFLGALTGGILTVSLVILLVRRILERDVRKLSVPNNFADLSLLLAITISGIAMYFPGYHADLPAVKSYFAGLLRLEPVELPHSIIFRAHFLLVVLLMIYFPFSRLMHLAGFFVCRFMLAENPPDYPTPAGNRVRSNFAARRINPKIPFSSKTFPGRGGPPE